MSNNTKRTPTVFQHIKAPNDSNGNPRRLYLVYSTETGRLVSVYDEGYGGRPAALRGVVELPPIEVSASEYKAWLRAEVSK